MGSYQVNIKIQPKSLKLLTEGTYTLCMAKACGNSVNKLVYNVVAVSATCTSNMSISWTDSYQIYGSTVTFNKGGILVSGSSDSRDIEFQQRYNLPNWSDPPSVVHDDQSPAHGFTFNNGVVASAVVSTSVVNPDGSTGLVPIYISPTEDIPGRDDLIPVAKVALWFQRSVKTSTMISLDLGTCCVIDLTYKSEQSVTYTDAGTWQFPGLHIDYTKATPADTHRTRH